MNNKDDSLIYKMVEIVLIISVEAFHKIGTTATNIFLTVFGRPLKIIKGITYFIKRAIKKLSR